MYIAIILILIALGGWSVMTGINKKRKVNIWLGIIVLLFTLVFFWFMSFWGDYLWFDSIGFKQRFLKEFWVKAYLIAIFGAVAFLIVLLLTIPVKGKQKIIRYLAVLAALIFGGTWGYSNWDIFLIFINRVPAGIADPVLNNDASFYMFTLPFIDNLYTFFFGALLISSIALYLDANSRDPQTLATKDPSVLSRYNNFFITLGLLLLVIGSGKIISKYELMYSTLGVVAGPGWTDIHVRIPAYWITFIITAGTGIVLMIPGLRKGLFRLLHIKSASFNNILNYFLTATAGMLFLIWLLFLSIIPALFQWLVVQPNEITRELPYISNNIKFTRYAFDLNHIEERQFPANRNFTQQTVDSNRSTFDNIRLWDWRALDAVYKQFQEIRLYYAFNDVDIDRYTFDSTYNQVMVSAREMKLENLPQQSKTFVNQRFKYTHGFGITLTKVNKFSDNGLPDILIRDIPPISRYPRLDVKQPRIYYGETTHTPVVVNSGEEEFDYPSGEKNIFYKYKGKGGVQVSSTWRKFLFGWKFDGTRFFLSGYPTKESRIMFYRQIKTRVNKLAPFLEFDEDPYIVLDDDGQLYWIIDAYTSSNRFPYSEPYKSRESIIYQENNVNKEIKTNDAPELNGRNYVRNSVKAVINAFNGDVSFYVYKPDDPVLQTWEKIFPGLFKKKSELSSSLQKHIRYPADLLITQGMVYAKYHMTDPAVFYNQEDLWIRATEKYYNNVQPVEPYYIMWQSNPEEKPEYILMMPFTPKNRQVLIGWIAGMCDGDNYGRFLAYKFPKEKRILGPQQVETKIDQDSYLSGQLTLWDQRGSNVIRGNVLAIPVSGTIVYVEPIYLQSETAAYPELRLVVIMHNDDLSYAESFDEALKGLFEDTGTGGGKVQEKVTGQVPEIAKSTDLIDQASDAFNRYLKFMGEQDFERSSKALKDLQQALEALKNKEQKP